MPETNSVSQLSPLQQRMHRIIFGTDTPAGKLFDVVLLWIILLSVISVMLESVRDIREAYKFAFIFLEWLFTALFTLEYVARIWSSPNRKAYIFSFMGVVDLLSLVPSFLSFFLVGSGSLMVIRSIRLIRVFRVLKLTQFMGGANQLGNALYNSRYKIVVFLGTVVCITVIVGTVMYLVEGSENGFTSIPISIYWAIVTITTVGYGDISPQTALGQSIASLLMILGYAIIAVPTGIVTSELANAKTADARKCHACNSLLTVESASFCHRCGTKIQEELKDDFLK